MARPTLYNPRQRGNSYLFPDSSPQFINGADLDNATLESYQDYLHRAYAAVCALQANVESQIDEELDLPEGNDSRYTQRNEQEQMDILRRRLQVILEAASENHLIHDKLVDIEEPV